MRITTPVVVFDFDNVIVRGSESFKQHAWDELFDLGTVEHRRLSEARTLFADGKGNRYDMLCHVYETNDREDDRVETAAERFDDIVRSKIRITGIHPDDRRALIEISKHVHLHIVSNTPEAALRGNVVFFESEYPEIKGVFDLVLGTPTKKPENLGIIREREGCSFNAITMIGDGENDRLAAETVSCNFIGITTVENKERWRDAPFEKVSTISHLKA